MPDHKRMRKIRQKVIDRDGLLCCYCEEFLLLNEVTMEHIVPVSKKGTYNTTNLTVACSKCNTKRDVTPFFKYCKKFNWSNAKIIKYKNLYQANLKIKILNISKEVCITNNEEVIPHNIIIKACGILNTKYIDFNDYFKKNDISLYTIYSSKEIKFYFEKIIKYIEKETL